jgi:hypothetical protein
MSLYTNFFFVLTDCAILWYDTEATTLTSGEQIESDLSSSVIQFYKFEVEVDLSPSSSRLPYVLPNETLSSTSKSFHNTSNKDVLQTKLYDHFLLLEDHYFAATLLH